MNRPVERILWTLGLAVLAVIAAQQAEAQKWKGKFLNDGDITVVENPATPLYPGTVLELNEEWSVGGERASGEPLIAKPRCIAVDDDGSLYVLDIQGFSISVIDKTGRFVRNIGRTGQGPGEIGASFSIVIPPRSQTLVVSDIGNHRLTTFTLEGRFQVSAPFRNAFSPVAIAIDSQGHVYLNTSPLNESKSILRKMSPDLTRILAEILDFPTGMSRNPFKPRDRWIVDDQDRLIYGNARTYEIRYYAPNGMLIRKVRRAHTPLKVTNSDIKEFLKRGAPPGVNPTYDFSSHHAAYRSFFVDDQRHLFVQTWERTVDNLQDIHDIFDKDGRFIGRIAMPRHEDLINPTFRILKKGKFYAITPDAEGFDVVKCYSVRWLIREAIR